VFSILAMLAGISVHGRYFKLFSLPGKTACAESIRVLSYNLRGMSMIPVEKGASVERRVESLYNAMNEAKEFPDIFCIQEGSKGDYIGNQFGLKHVIHGTKSTLWILSRFPIVKQGELQGEESNPFCIWADVKTNDGILRVYNMHLMSNRVTNTTEELIQDMDFQKENTWNSIRFIMSRYRYTTKKRAKEAGILHDHMKQCPYPAIIAGDGNDTPISHTYHVLTEGLSDSFRERGAGFSTTYDSTLPLLRIDYILGTSQIQFKDHITHHMSYSDHYPVSSGICISAKRGS
jgi:endonuclease/exonuclease/phosphatase family metal-dependent hydrolase